MDFTSFGNPYSSNSSEVISSLYTAYAFLQNFTSYTDLIIQKFYDLYDRTSFYSMCHVIFKTYYKQLFYYENIKRIFLNEIKNMLQLENTSLKLKPKNHRKDRDSCDSIKISMSLETLKSKSLRRNSTHSLIYILFSLYFIDMWRI